jgi:beta-aspartyl-peptidase (threonine type)
MSAIALALHGGCGTPSKEDLPPEEWAEAKRHIADALAAGWAILAGGGAAVDAVEATVVVLEDSHHFNAGHGAALNTDAEHELDAAIMEGAALRAGAVCAARHIRNPVKAARKLMEEGVSLLLTGPAADAYARDAGLEMVAQSYFTTERRLRNLQQMKARAIAGTAASASEAEKHGTVGAVALDREGNLAAATSTGGYTNKPAGRVGDSPIIGAGTYARNGVCAVSGTGQGELFIRHVAGHEVASLIAYKGMSLADATRTVVFDRIGGGGLGAGMVAVDAAGNVAAPFNTVGMYRGWVLPSGELHVATHDQVALVAHLAGGDA